MVKLRFALAAGFGSGSVGYVPGTYRVARSCQVGVSSKASPNCWMLSTLSRIEPPSDATTSRLPLATLSASGCCGDHWAGALSTGQFPLLHTYIHPTCLRTHRRRLHPTSYLHR